jgi:hypothetical protein
MPIHFIEMKARLLELLGRRNGLRPSQLGASPSRNTTLLTND